MSSTTVTVTGMTCDHCAQAVRREVGALTGVTAVDVDVTTGAVRIDSATDLDRDDVDRAVVAAGYAIS